MKIRTSFSFWREDFSFSLYPPLFTLCIRRSGAKHNMMLKAVAVFFTCLVLLFTTAAKFPNLNAFFTFSGWIVVVVYAANVVTRWILSIMPQETVEPKGKAVVITGKKDLLFVNKE